MKPPSTILLVHPNIENVTSEGVILHELGHYFDYKYHFSKDKEFIEIKNKIKIYLIPNLIVNILLNVLKNI